VNRALFAVCALALVATAGRAAGDAPSHAAWSSLLADCVQGIDGGASTAVDYGCFTDRRERLETYLASLSALDRGSFDALAREERLAFLINAYNAWTVELILRSWPGVASIRDLGTLFRSPWKRAFIPLFGDELSLDDIEHGMIREPGRYDEPRIHFAVNCASIGCPALRREAYEGARLEAQLADQTRRFLGDRSRNRLRDGRLEISPLFKWYADDFASGWRGADSVEGFLARYADVLGLDDTARRSLLAGDLPLRFLDYDWSLNDLP
jgi:hypothetical protein